MAQGKGGGHIEGKGKMRGLRKARDGGPSQILLTLDDIGDASISLNPQNLLFLCKDCHNKMHGRFKGQLPKYRWNEDGDLIEVREAGNR
jgi:hypothetical protein